MAHLFYSALLCNTERDLSGTQFLPQSLMEMSSTVKTYQKYFFIEQQWAQRK